jgi:2'-5' RNA ligase
LKREIEAVAFVTGYEVFPTKDGTKCLVARLQCDLAEKLSHELTKMGATSDYPTYKAHVTLCELYTGSEAVETFPKPQFPLHFHKLIVEPLIE